MALIGQWRHGRRHYVPKEEPLGPLAEMKATADLQAQDRFISVSGANAIRASADALVVGVGRHQHGPPNFEVGVQIGGVGTLELGATTAVGDHLKSDAGGVGFPTTTAGDPVGAVALEAGRIGDIVHVIITPGGRY